MTKLIDSSYLKVTSNEEGGIWIIDGDKMPKKMDIKVDEFVEDVVGSNKYKFVRVLASPVNYNLITKLYTLKEKGLVESLQLATPALMQSNRPESSLLRMRLCTLPASLGGFHEATDDDFTIYTMARLARILRSIEIKMLDCGNHIPLKLEREYKKVCSVMIDTLNTHPVWQYISFIDSIDPVIAGVVLANIGDPRWFVNPDKPDRLSRMYSWMGLAGEHNCPDKIYRKNSTMLCWYGGNYGGFVEYKDFPTIVKDKLSDPACFILKHAYDTWGPEHAVWPREKISKYLIKFIRLAWLDCIYPYPNPWMEGLFDYRTFFKSSKDLKEFTNFIEK